MREPCSYSFGDSDLSTREIANVLSTFLSGCGGMHPARRVKKENLTRTGKPVLMQAAPKEIGNPNGQ
jgi:hypothetical protein